MRQPVVYVLVGKEVMDHLVNDHILQGFLLPIVIYGDVQPLASQPASADNLIATEIATGGIGFQQAEPGQGQFAIEILLVVFPKFLFYYLLCYFHSCAKVQLQYYAMKSVIRFSVTTSITLPLLMLLILKMKMK